MDAYTGEIRLLPYNFAPVDWLWCNGQVLPINQFQALYAVIGNRYGGSYVQGNFGLPNLMGRAVVSATLSNGGPPGLTRYPLGQTFGVTTVVAPLAAHAHTPQTGLVAGAPPMPAPTATEVVNNTAGNFDFAPAGTTPLAPMAPQTLSNSINPTLGQNGIALAHTNIQPFLSLYFAICYNGYFPSPP